LGVLIAPGELQAENKPDFSYKRAKKIRLSLGVAATDESDDRFRTGIMAEGGYKRWMARLQHLSRSGDAYEEQTVLSTFGYQFGFGRIPFTKLILEGTVGLGISYQSQEIKVEELKTEEGYKNSSWNAGASLGLQFVAPFDRLYLSAGWESRLYPVGEASLFLVVARKKWEASVLVGPPTLGSGGSNPIGIPPVSAAEYELTLTTKSRWHFRLGLTPHIAAAGRMFKLKYGFETAVGASIVNSLHGYGPGIFSVFGWSSPCAFKRLCFSAQYIQDVGLSLTQWQITAPFAVRMGLVWKL